MLAPLRKSCVLTLGFKHKIRGGAAKIFKKYGVNLKITKLGKEVIRLFYPTSLKTKLNFKIKTVNLQFPALMEEEINTVPGSNKSNVKTVDVC